MLLNMLLKIAEIEEVDKKVRETIHPEFYGQLVRDLTQDAELAKKAEEIVVLAGRYILLWDRYYEINDKRYQDAAEDTKQSLLDFIPISKKEFEQAYESIAPFWEYERTLLDHGSFSFQDREEYFVRKSSDIPFYFGLLRKITPIDTADEAVFRTLQKLNDMYDDFIDISEDITDGVPNIILLFNKQYKAVGDLASSERKELLDRAKKLHEKVASADGLSYLKNEADTYLNSVRSLLSQ